MFTLDRRLFVLLSALSFAACRGDDPGGSESSSTTADSDSNSSTGGTPTTTAASSSSGGESSTTGDPTTSTTDNSAGFITTATTTNDTNTGPKPNGSECASDDECISMNCFSTLGGMLTFCADCNEDQDCVDAGTGTACTLDIAANNATCTAGEVGSTCMSDEACASGHCDAVIEVPIPGLLPDTCGDCGDSADCMNMQLCSPTFDFMAFSGNKACVDPGSVENNNLCPKGPDGPMVCKSSHCTSATIMGLVEVFICGECDTDKDCAMGQTCNPAEASMNGISGSVCA